VVFGARNAWGSSYNRPSRDVNNGSMSSRQRDLSNNRPPSANASGGINDRGSVNAIRRRTVRRTAGAQLVGTGKHDGPRNARHRDSGPIARAGQAQVKGVVRRMRPGRRGRVLETAELLLVGIHDQTRPLTTAIGRQLHRLMAAAVYSYGSSGNSSGNRSYQPPARSRRAVESDYSMLLV